MAKGPPPPYKIFKERKKVFERVTIVFEFERNKLSTYALHYGRRKKEKGKRKKEKGRRKKEEGRRKKEEGRYEKDDTLVSYVSMCSGNNGL